MPLLLSVVSGRLASQKGAEAGLFEMAVRRQAFVDAVRPDYGKRDAIREAPRLVAVLFADCNPDLSLLEALAQAGFAGAMLDTADKTRGGLRRHWDDAGLNNFVKRAQRLGLIAGLAGSLQLEDVSDLIQLGPDYLGFRGALCADTERNRGLRASRVSALRNAIPRLLADTSRAVG